MMMTRLDDKKTTKRLVLVTIFTVETRRFKIHTGWRVELKELQDSRKDQGRYNTQEPASKGVDGKFWVIKGRDHSLDLVKGPCIDQQC